MLSAILLEELVPIEAVAVVGGSIGLFGGWALGSVRQRLRGLSYTAVVATAAIAMLGLSWASGGNREDNTILPRMVTSLAVLVELYGTPESIGRWVGLCISGAMICMLALFVGPLALWVSLFLLAWIVAARWFQSSTQRRKEE
jgi:hypothetical protein